MVVETTKGDRWNGIMKVTYLFPEATPDFVDRLRVSVERNIGKYEMRICHKGDLCSDTLWQDRNIHQCFVAKEAYGSEGFYRDMRESGGVEKDSGLGRLGPGTFACVKGR